MRQGDVEVLGKKDMVWLVVWGCELSLTLTYFLKNRRTKIHNICLHIQIVG